MGKWNEIKDWHDDWLINNLYTYSTFNELAQGYNEIFGTNYNLGTIKSHCKRKLKLYKPEAKCNNRYTKEQREWIKENYPLLGETETTKRFNEKFHTNKPVHSIVNHAFRYDIKVNKDVSNKNRGIYYDPKRKYQLGETKLLKDRRYIKTNNGWIALQRYIYEKETGKKIPKNWHVIFLDGNVNNFDISNLIAIPIKYNGILSGFGLRSSDPELTKTGVIWCELYDALGINKDKLNRSNRELFDCTLED